MRSRNWRHFLFKSAQTTPGTQIGPIHSPFDFVMATTVRNRLFLLWEPLDVTYWNQFTGVSGRLDGLYELGLEFVGANDFQPPATGVKRGYPAHADKWWLYFPIPGTDIPGVTRIITFLNVGDGMYSEPLTT